MTIDPYVNKSSWDQMVLAGYDVEVHPIAVWLKHRYQSVSEYRVATAHRLAEWTTSSYKDEIISKKEKRERLTKSTGM